MYYECMQLTFSRAHRHPIIHNLTTSTELCTLFAEKPRLLTVPRIALGPGYDPLLSFLWFR